MGARTATLDTFSDPTVSGDHHRIIPAVAGRASARTTRVDGRTIAQGFTWNDLGSLSWQSYPNDSVLADGVEPPRKVINTYTLGFLTKVCEGATPPTCTTNYASSISYHPNLMVNQVTHGNSVVDTYAKDDNDMRRPKSVATTNTAANWSTGTYQYDGSGNVWKIGASEVFVYDKVSRLTSGTILAAGVTRTQTAAYDAFGNMTTTTTHFGTRSFTVSGTTNHVTNLSFSYDAAGNQSGWSDGSQTYTYTYTPLNELKTYTTLGVNHTYLYTADGERIEDWDNAASTRTISVRDLSGKVLRLHARNSSGQWSWSKDYVCRDGLQVASVEPPVATPVVKHFHLDHLGTVRRITGTGTPAAVLASHDLYPFGLEATSLTQDTERMKFTGHERDLHSASTQNDDLDDMHARYYNPNVARFLSVDPLRGNPKQPQSWNLFAYVGNNPLNRTDPTGKAAADFARSLEKGIDLALGFVDNHTSGSTLGIGVVALATTVGDIAKGTTDLLKVGEATGAAIGSGACREDVLGAVAKDAGRAGGLALMLVAPTTVKAAARTPGSFFEGANYSSKVAKQMQGAPGEFHSFPEAVRAFEDAGTVRTVLGGDGVARKMLEIPGAYQTSGGSWLDGVFQFIKDADGTINHRMFVPGS